MILKRKCFTVYDETDSLKRMKDSDILAEQKKKKQGLGTPLFKTGIGAGVGAGIGAIGGGLMKSKGSSLGTSIAKGGKLGAALGAITAGTIALNKRHDANKNIGFYNDRLEYAQTKAKRRERKDWKSNMTNRDGYTY